MNSQPSPDRDLSSVIQRLDSFIELRAAEAVRLQLLETEVARVRDLETEVSALRRQLSSESRSQVSQINSERTNGSAYSCQGPEAETAELTDRRGMMKRVGAIAVGVAAAGLLRPCSSSGANSRNATVAAPSADGGNFILGQANVAQYGTFLLSQTSFLTDRVLGVSGTGNNGAPVPFEKVAIHGAVDATGTTTPNAVIAGIRGDGRRSGGTGFAMGVIGEGTDLGGLFKGTGAALRLIPGNTSVANPNQTVPVNGGSGDLYCGSANGSLWYKTSTSGANAYRRLADATTAGQLTILPTPVRFIDTRNGTGGAGGAFQNGTVRQYNFRALQPGTIPYSARGIVGNLTAASPTGNGNFQTNTVNSFPSGSAAVMSFRTGVNLSNHFLSALDANGVMFVRANFATVHLVLDIQGYYL